MALLDKGKSKPKGDDYERSMPKKEAPEEDTGPVKCYSGLTLEELLALLSEVAYEHGAEFVDHDWNGVSKMSLKSDSFDEIAAMLEAVRGMAISHGFRATFSIDVRGSGPGCGIIASMPGKVTKKHF